MRYSCYFITFLTFCFFSACKDKPKLIQEEAPEGKLIVKIAGVETTFDTHAIITEYDTYRDYAIYGVNSSNEEIKIRFYHVNLETRKYQTKLKTDKTILSIHYKNANDEWFYANDSLGSAQSTVILIDDNQIRGFFDGSPVMGQNHSKSISLQLGRYYSLIIHEVEISVIKALINGKIVKFPSESKAIYQQMGSGRALLVTAHTPDSIYISLVFSKMDIQPGGYSMGLDMEGKGITASLVMNKETYINSSGSVFITGFDTSIRGSFSFMALKESDHTDTVSVLLGMFNAKIYQ